MKEKGIFITCILCPLGCRIEVKKDDGDYEVYGISCKRGKEYAIKELTNPTRTLTTTVKTNFKDFPRLPARTDKEVPLKAIFIFMKEINSVCVKKRLKPGDIIIKGILNTDINLIAADEITPINY